MPKLILPNRFKPEHDEPAHIARMKSVSKWKLPKEGSDAWVDFRLRSAASMRSPEFRKQVKDASRVGVSTAVAVSSNGAGLPADAGIREFGDDYNRRVIQHGLHYLPLSYNIFEAFFSYHAKYAIFVPLQEKDHICSISGFLDYLANKEEVRSDSYDFLHKQLAEDVIHNYSFTDEIQKWSFGSGENTFCISSATIVRRHDEVTVMCLAGRDADLSSATQEILRVKLQDNPDKPDLLPDPKLIKEAVSLHGSNNLWRSYLSLRFSLKTNSIQARYAMSDIGQSWKIVSDDPVSLGSVRSSFEEANLEAFVREIDEHSEVFSFLVRLLELPSYFALKENLVTKEKSITELSQMSTSMKSRRTFEKSLPSQLVYERSVYSMQDVTNELSGVLLPPLVLKVEIEGFWKPLPFGTYGAGQDGERVLGRTWVKKTLASRQSEIPSSSMIAQQGGASSVLLKNEEGHIYVLRNASHQLDIFKIGLTRRDVGTRAAELSRGTGVPDQFLTVQFWWVPDVVYAEKRIHSLLDQYRLRDNREFFKVDFSTIRSTVDMVVGEMAGRTMN